MFTIKWKEGAIRQLDKLQPLLSRRILKKVADLREDPSSKGIKRLKGEKAFSLRVGDYRIIFDLDMKNEIITILRVGHRKNIY